MMFRTLLALLAGIVCCLMGRPAEADETQYQFHKTVINLPEFPPSEAYILEASNHSLTFIPPHDARVAVDHTNGEVHLTFRDNRCQMVLRHSDLNAALVARNGWDSLRELIKLRYPDAEVSEAAECLNSCGGRGCSFVIRQKTEYRQFKLNTRISFIPTANGVLEVSMTATSDKFAAQQFPFNSFLNCLRLDKTSLRPSHTEVLVNN